MIARVGSFRWAIWIGWIITTLSLGLLVLLDVDTPKAVWVVLFVVAGLGQGVLFIAHSVASQAACRARDAAHASAMYSFMRSLGLCLGVALGGTIWTNLLLGRVVRVHLPVRVAVEFAGNTEDAVRLTKELPDAVKSRVMEAVAWSFQMLFAVLCGVSGLGLVVACCFIRAHSLDQELETEHVLLRDEGEKNGAEGQAVAEPTVPVVRSISNGIR